MTHQDSKQGKKLQLRKETIKDLKIGNRAAGFPCDCTDLDPEFDPEEFETAVPPKGV